ncbi:hypothetical protein R1sor_020110 [Riccia sorocarpa]|uniref:SAP domain-containing protein n=1 Tax=Riccia sorocarpa TaxID=122646 RepID=A0ABD3IEE1_9MARC
MTRPPRPKYPSDLKNYHELRKPGCAHTIRLPEELLVTYVDLKRALGARTTHADVIRFLFEAADPAIQAALQSDAFRVVHDSQEEGVPGNDEEIDPDVDFGDLTLLMVSGRSNWKRTMALLTLQPDSSLDLWEEHKANLHQELLRKGTPLVVYVDCRFDSSRSGYHGTLPQLRDYCREHGLPQSGAKLQLVQRVSVHLKSWIYTCAKNAAVRGDTTP